MMKNLDVWTRVAKQREHTKMQAKLQERKIWQSLSRISLKDICLRAQHVGVERSQLDQALNSQRPKHHVSALVVEREMLLLLPRAGASDVGEAAIISSPIHDTRSSTSATLEMQPTTDSEQASIHASSVSTLSTPESELRADNKPGPGASGRLQRTWKATGTTVLASLRRHDDATPRTCQQQAQQELPQTPVRTQLGDTERADWNPVAHDQKHDGKDEIGAVGARSTARVESSLRSSRSGSHSKAFHASLTKTSNANTRS